VIGSCDWRILVGVMPRNLQRFELFVLEIGTKTCEELVGEMP
jgi:hypothetical protein